MASLCSQPNLAGDRTQPMDGGHVEISERSDSEFKCADRPTFLNSCQSSFTHKLADEDVIDAFKSGMYAAGIHINDS